jgi:hypothetical protein
MLTLSSCISEYSNPSVVGSEALVVEGIIEEGETVITLSKSVGVEETADITIYVSDAEVSVEGSDGTVWKSAKADYLGHYRINIDKLLPDVQYRVRIVLDGDEYVSEYAKPEYAPENGKFSWRLKRGDDSKVEICVTTPAGGGNLYRWTYKEDWEVRANLFAEGTMDIQPGSATWTYYWIDDYQYNKYYCWQKDNSVKLLLSDSRGFNADSVTVVLTEIDRRDERLSVLYAMTLEQHKLPKEAYDYLSLMQKNTENTGGLFDPMPTYMDGNVKCITDTDKRVLGFVCVSVPNVKRGFVWRDEGAYKPIESPMDCPTPIFHTLEEYSMSDIYGDEEWMWLRIKSEPTESGYFRFYDFSFTLRTCADCTLKGTKDKPSWWPNTIGYE